MGKNKYVGHRYVPKLDGEWDKSKSYESLTIVQYQGASYTSRQNVPAGVEITNEEFWVLTGNYNAQVEQYRQELTAQLAQKANKTELQQVSLVYKESYPTITDLQTAYPTGSIYNHVVLADNKIYTWSNNSWTNTGVEPNGVIPEKLENAIFDNSQEFLLLKPENTKVDLIITSGKFITSSNHASGAGKVVSTAIYGMSDIKRFKKGTKLKIRAFGSANIAILAKYDKNGLFLNELIIGDEITSNYDYTVIDEYEYLRISNNSTKVAEPYIAILSETVDVFNTIFDNKIALVNDSQVVNPQAIRKPVINFQFDDGNATDSNVYNVFKAKGFVCGFSLMSSISTSRVDEYLGYQSEGFEILSHSTDSTAMSDGTTDPAIIEQKMKDSKTILEDRGFNISGWVTPSSQLHESYLPILKKYYQFGFTQYLGVWDKTKVENPYDTFDTGTVNLKRMSAESSTLQGCIDAIDKTITDGGMLSFYAHLYPNTLTEEKLTGILNHLRTKVDNGECLVLNPTDAYRHYFTLRHSDFLQLMNV